MTRSLPEWRGKTDDSPVPTRVKIRVFDAHDGRCHISGQKILPGDAWEVEHILPLWKGGEHREANLAPALTASHKGKTAAEAKERAKSNSVRKRHLGLAKPTPSRLKQYPPSKAYPRGRVVDRKTGDVVWPR